MVKDSKGLIQYIKGWVIRQAKMNNKTSVVFDRAGIESALLEAILQDSGLSVVAIAKEAIDAHAIANNSLVLSTANKVDYEILRNKNIRGGVYSDINPLARIYPSEIMQLINELRIAAFTDGNINEYDLYEEEIENAAQLVERATGQIDAQSMIGLAAVLEGHVHPRKLEVMRKMAEIERATRVRYNPNLPVCDVRDPGMGLVE